MESTTEQSTSEDVLLCFYINEAFSINNTELSQMVYSVSVEESILYSDESLCTPFNTQRWLNKSKLIWRIPRTEFLTSESEFISIAIYKKLENEEDSFSPDNQLCTFNIAFVPVEETINWNNVFELEIDNYRFHFHVHAQPCYSSFLEINSKKENGTITLTSNDDKTNNLESDYALEITINSVNNWSIIEENLKAQHVQSNNYTIYSRFNKEYQSLARTTFTSDSDLLPFEPIYLHSSISNIASYLHNLEPPTIHILSSNTSFTPDFERFSYNLACCPPTSHITNKGNIQLNETIEFLNLSQDEQSCPAYYNNKIYDDVTMIVTICLRKKEEGSNTVQSIVNLTTTKEEKDVQIEIWKRKLANMEEFNKETVSQYEKELEAKQRTIAQLTQANREFEKLCITSVTTTSDNAAFIKLQNENIALKAKIKELELKNAQLQKEKDEIREVMVRVCTTGKTE